jgi:hypothetical protein
MFERKARGSLFPPECVPQMLGRCARGSGGDRAAPQPGACKINELSMKATKHEKNITQATSNGIFKNKTAL